MQKTKKHRPEILILLNVSLLSAPFKFQGFYSSHYDIKLYKI